VLGNIAADANHVAYINEDYSQSPTPGKSFSNWVVMARTENDLGILLESTEWRPLKTGMGGRPWTDNFSDLLSVIRWSPQQPSESQKAKGSYIARGLAFVDRGDLPQAAACFQQAIQIDRADFAAHSWLGAVLQKQGRSDEAIDEYRQALRSNRWLVKVHISLADLLFARGEAESAKEHLEAALAIDPRVAEAHGRLGRILASQKRYEEAVEHYRKGLEIDPRALGTHLHFGEELRRQGRFDEAIEHFRKAVEIQPGDAQTRDALRDALGKQATDRRAAEPAKP
jgi:tetratricopeptide (TPR) repeat protein